MLVCLSEYIMGLCAIAENAANESTASWKKGKEGMLLSPFCMVLNTLLLLLLLVLVFSAQSWTQGEIERTVEERRKRKEGSKGTKAAKASLDKIGDTCIVQELCLLETVDPMRKILKKG